MIFYLIFSNLLEKDENAQQSYISFSSSKEKGKQTKQTDKIIITLRQTGAKLRDLIEIRIVRMESHMLWIISRRSSMARIIEQRPGY